MITGKSIDQLKVGDKASFGKTVSESDIYSYAGITGDFNPAHINETYANTCKGVVAFFNFHIFDLGPMPHRFTA